MIKMIKMIISIKNDKVIINIFGLFVSNSSVHDQNDLKEYRSKNR